MRVPIWELDGRAILNPTASDGHLGDVRHPPLLSNRRPYMGSSLDFMIVVYIPFDFFYWISCSTQVSDIIPSSSTQIFILNALLASTHSAFTMVSFKHLLLFGITLARTTIAVPNPRLGTPDWTPSISNPSVKDAVPHTVINVPAENKAIDIVERQPPRRGRMTLQWSREGLFIFLLGWDLQAMIDSFTSVFYGAGEGGPGRVLYEQFWNWLTERHGEALNDNRYVVALNFLNNARAGGVYGLSGHDSVAAMSYADLGFGIIAHFIPTTAQLRALQEVIAEWAGSTVMIVERPNGFFSPTSIGAGGMKRRGIEARSRTNICPKVGNMLDWATVDVPVDVDINREIRWAGKCF